MRKNTRRLCIGIAAVAVLGSVYAWLMLHPAEEDDETPAADLVSMDTADLASVQVSPRDGGSYTVAFSADDSGTEYTMSGDDLDYSESLMQSLMEAVSSISARPVEQACTALDQYGLSDSDQTDTVVITDTDGTKTTLTLGLSNDFGTYCTTGNSDVYLLDSDTAESLTQPQSYYRNLTILGGYYTLSNELYTLSIDHMADGSTVSIQARDTDALDENAVSAYSDFVFTAPTKCDANDSEMSSMMGELESGLTANAIVADDPDDLSQYGLDDPVHISMTANNLDATVLVGDTTDDGQIYVMLAGGRTVFACNASYFDFLNDDWNSWRSTNLMPCALCEIDQIVITNGSKTHTADITHVQADENEKEDSNTETAVLDGNDMTDDELEQLFLAVSSINYNRLVDNPQAAETAEAEVTVTLTMTDGSTRSIAFAKGGSREYLASVNGGAYVYGVPQDDVTSILKQVTDEANDADDDAS